MKKYLPTVTLFLAAILVFLYAFGYYDFIFIKRPDTVPEETSPEETAPPEDTAPPETEAPDAPVTDAPAPEAPPSEPVQLPTLTDVNTAGSEGYYLTTQPYTSDMLLAELFTAVEKTDALTLRNRLWNKPVYKYEYENSEAELVWTPTEEAMPALEAYMGFLFADDGETVRIYDSYGKYLNRFSSGYYEFAYKRDANGNPLLRRAYKYTAFTEDHEESADFKAFEYFALGADGGVYETDYNDSVEDRGLIADYPAYYGAMDSDFGRSCAYNDVVQKTVKGKLKSFIRTRWTITRDGEPLNDAVYYAAYPYSEGYACVTDEEGVMYFVDEDGNRAFETKKEYVNSGKRYVVERLLLPFDESTALGCYYFEYGLVKARRQIYDLYQLKDYDIMFVMSDEYVMLYSDGTEFPVPSGYSVDSYSNGVMLLEKNGVYGYMNYTGAWLNTPDYEDAKPFSEGLAACKKNGKWGLIDNGGRTVLPFAYDYIQSVSSGVIVCHSESGWNTYLKMSAK